MGQRSMNCEQVKTSHSILQAVQFLVEEAERDGVVTIARILQACAKNMRLVLMLEANPSSTSNSNENMKDKEI